MSHPRQQSYCHRTYLVYVKLNSFHNITINLYHSYVLVKKNIFQE